MLKGSHLAGRVEHVAVGEQVGADLERVNELKKVRKTQSIASHIFLQSVAIVDNATGSC